MQKSTGACTVKDKGFHRLDNVPQAGFNSTITESRFNYTYTQSPRSKAISTNLPADAMILVMFISSYFFSPQVLQ